MTAMVHPAPTSIHFGYFFGATFSLDTRGQVALQSDSSCLNDTSVRGRAGTNLIQLSKPKCYYLWIFHSLNKNRKIGILVEKNLLIMEVNFFYPEPYNVQNFACTCIVQHNMRMNLRKKMSYTIIIYYPSIHFIKKLCIMVVLLLSRCMIEPLFQLRRGIHKLSRSVLVYLILVFYLQFFFKGGRGIFLIMDCLGYWICCSIA